MFDTLYFVVVIRNGQAAIQLELSACDDKLNEVCRTPELEQQKIEKK